METNKKHITITLFGFAFFKERAGIISPNELWICFKDEYMYDSPTLFGLIKQIITEYRDDKHLIG
jgi:hypothetical protein